MMTKKKRKKKIIDNPKRNNQNSEAPRPEFESESLARQARMIGHYTTGAQEYRIVRGKSVPFLNLFRCYLLKKMVTR